MPFEFLDAAVLMPESVPYFPAAELEPNVLVLPSLAQDAPVLQAEEEASIVYSFELGQPEVLGLGISSTFR